MKRILKQLLKLFPNAYIVIEHEVKTRDAKIVDTYKVYLQNLSIYPHGWSNEFSTLKELDEELSNKIDNYKKVY